MRKNSTLSRLIATNLLLVLVVMAIMLPLGFRITRVISAQEAQDRQSTLQNGVDDIAMQLSSLSDILTQTSTLRVFTRLSIIRETLHPSDYLYIQRAQELLMAIASSNHSVLDILLTFDANELVITRYLSFDSRAVFSQQYQFIGMDADAILALSNPPEARLLPAFTVDSTHVRMEQAALCYRLPMRLNAYSPLQAVTYVLLRRDYVLSALMTTSLRDSGAIRLMDRSGQVLLAYTAPGYDVAPEDEAAATITAYDRRGLLRVDAVLDPQYTRDMLREINLFIGLCIGGAFLIGLIGAVTSALRQSRPIRLLLAELEAQGLATGMQRDDYLRLKDSIMQTAAAHKGYASQLQANQRLMRANLLDHALHTGYLEARQEKAFQAQMPGFPARFVVGYGCLPDVDPAQDRSMLNMVLADRLAGALPEGSIVHPLLGSAFALIIPWREDLAPQLEKACAEVSLGDGSRFALAISMPATQVGQIHAAFEQAQLRFARRKGDQWLITQPVEPGGTDAGPQDLQVLQRAILSGDYPTAETIINDLLYRADIPDVGIEERYYMLRLHLQGTFRQLMPGETLSLPKYQASMPPQHYLGMLLQTAETLCMAAESKKRSHNTGLRDRIFDYVRRRFCDPTLSVAGIAGALGISEKYLYAFFKEQTGLSPALYVQQLRLEHAATLLRTTQISVQRIGEQSGFGALNTFYKAFKRVYGLTPSQYRDMERPPRA